MPYNKNRNVDTKNESNIIIICKERDPNTKIWQKNIQEKNKDTHKTGKERPYWYS